MYNDYFKQLKDSFNTIYDHLYKTDDYTSEDVEKGEKLLKKNAPLVILCNHVRQDILSSDRELATFYKWTKINTLI
jgi:hypothetical protein